MIYSQKVERAWGMALALYTLERIVARVPALTVLVSSVNNVALLIFGHEVMLEAVDRVALDGAVLPESDVPRLVLERNRQYDSYRIMEESEPDVFEVSAPSQNNYWCSLEEAKQRLSEWKKEGR